MLFVTKIEIRKATGKIAMGVSPVFLTTWVIGIAVTAFIFWATSGQNWTVRVPLRTRLHWPVTFTPSIAAGGHGGGLAPAMSCSYWGPVRSVRATRAPGGPPHYVWGATHRDCLGSLASGGS